MYGFPKELYEVQYHPKGCQELTDDILALLPDISINDDWGIEGPQNAYDIGKALAPLREKGYLLLGSGNIVHNLRRLEWDNPNGSPQADRFDAFITGLVKKRDNEKIIHYEDNPDAAYAAPGELRYAAVRLLYELLRLPDEADTARCPARQVECVREAETLVLQDLSVRRPARELADHFGLSESGFKLYCQNVLGEGYLAYFRRRRLERAAELLRTTPQRVQDIAARVGYESQGRFAQAFYDQFRLTPLEYRRLSK